MMCPTTSRRRFLLGGVAAWLLTGLGPSCATRNSRRHVVFATWGGSWEQAMRRAWFAPFTAETGIEVTTVSDPSYGRIRAMVETGHTEWDVVEVNPDFQWIGARAGLLEE